MKKSYSQSFRLQKKTRVLWGVASVFIISAVIRAGYGFGPALAQVTEVAPEITSTVASSNNPSGWEEVLAALSAREERLIMREQQIKEREKLLENANQQLNEKLNELSLAEERLQATISMASTAAEDDIMRLVSVYQAMKSKDAAQLFEKMAPDFAAGFLGRMAPEAAAGILAGMNPETAYALSAVLAGRNANSPRN